MSTTVESLELEIRSSSASAVQGIDALTQSLTKLKSATKNLGLSNVATGMGKVANATKQARDSNQKVSVSFTDLFHKLKVGITVFKTVGKAIYSFIEKSSDYVENVNLFTVSMGEYADSAKSYAESVGEIMGIDPGEWMRNQGIFMTLATGFGVASDRAATMSQNLTQLGYDLSSFFNISYEDAMQKLQSGLSGELEPLRRIGYDLSQAKLEAVALELGIDKAVSSMTQAEKAELRYYAIMTQVTTAHGDMARTLEAPANQMKIFKAQLEMTAREIGNIFIPALNAILPYAIAVTKVIRQLASSIASIVGFEMPEVDYSGVESMGDTATDTSDALDDAADSAKKLKSYMLGIDELNVINPNTEESAGDTLGFDFELPEYDFIGGATNERVEGIVKTIEEFFEPLEELFEKTTTWAEELDLEPIDKAFKELGATVETVGGKIFDILSWVYEEVILPLAEWSIEEGLPTAIETLATALDALGKALTPVQEGLKELKKDLEPIFEWIGEVVIVALEGFESIFGKLADVCDEKGPEITSIFTGIGDVISKVWEIIEPIADAALWVLGLVFDLMGDVAAIDLTFLIDSISSFVDIFAGIANGDWDQVWGGVSGIFEACWTRITDTLLAWWDFFVELFTPVANWFDEKVIQPVGDFFKGLWESVSGFFVNLWNDIVGVWNTVATWFDENVVQPIVDFFAPIEEWISDVFEGCWLIIQAVWLEASTWFDETFIQPVVSKFGEMKASVSGHFASLWEKICLKWEEASTWFSETIIEPVKTAFQEACTAIEGVFSSLWLRIRQGVANAMNGVIEDIESAINWIIGGINGLIGGFDKIVQWAADVLGKDWGGMTLVSEVSFSRITVPAYAEGGFPEQGQMFVAREAGAEMVGNIGRRTAVANNDQIVSGIAGGVAEANEEQNTLLREQNSLLRAILEKDSSTYLDGRSLTHSVEKYQRERGRVLITGGVV